MSETVDPRAAAAAEAVAPAVTAAVAAGGPTRLGDLSAVQWRSGIAAWLGWLFDGLDMHLYTLVATPFVAQLLATGQHDRAVDYYSSIIQASFLVGWALGGGLFGRLGDRLGRARALMLTILTYACFTGLSFFAQTWWQLMLCRFLAALGVGGEWAVGAALLSETWPRRWRPWVAATLQTAVNLGVLLAMLAVFVLSLIPLGGAHGYYQYRVVFLVGVLPALLVLWIRRAVPEPEEWHAARASSPQSVPGIGQLFRGQVRRITVLTMAVCALSLSAHWAFMFWFIQHLRKLPGVAAWSDVEKTRFQTVAMVLVMLASIVGNYLAAAIARWLGYRRAIVLMLLGYCVAMTATYGVVRGPWSVLAWLVGPGLCQGVFGLFTMYLPPLFPTLLRTTGAGFCYNIGRIVAAFGTVYFGVLAASGNGGLLADVQSNRLALLYSSVLFIPAAAAAMLLPEPPD